MLLKIGNQNNIGMSEVTVVSEMRFSYDNIKVESKIKNK